MVKKLEQETLASFLESAGKLTITEYGKITGIERTRFFRLIHGADMKVKEFVSLQLYIKQTKGTAVDWSKVMGDFSLKQEVGVQSKGKEDGLLQFERTMRLRNLIDNTVSIAA